MRNDLERRVLSAMRGRGAVTPRSLAAAFQITEARALKVLQRLRDDGLVDLVSRREPQWRAKSRGFEVYPGEIYRHVRRGTTYRVVGLARFQGDLEYDTDPVVLYVRVESSADLGLGEMWCRPLSEFTDGRFERVGDDDG